MTRDNRHLAGSNGRVGGEADDLGHRRVKLAVRRFGHGERELELENGCHLFKIPEGIARLARTRKRATLRRVPSRTP